MMLQGRVLAGRYALGAMLGAGGMAQVYRARDRVLQRTVAVKVLRAPYDQDPDLVARFGREARAAAALNHPNVVAIFDSGTDGQLHYLVMEYVEGDTLAALLHRKGPLAPESAARLAHQVCQALAAAHARGLVHRDVKPANVLVSDAGLVKVADFGIAKAAATPTLTGGGKVLGTAAYLAPEQAQGGPVDARSDLYALGCVLYELLTGAPPFVGDSPVTMAAQHVTELPESPSRRNPKVGADLEAVVLTALAKRPGDRYQTATAMAAALERVAADHAAADMPLFAWAAAPAPHQPASPTGAPDTASTVVMAPPRTARRARWRRWALVAGAGIVALLAVALWLRDGTPTDRQSSAGPSTSSPPAITSPAPTTPPTQPQAGPPAALAVLTEAVTTGQQQGTVDKGAEDLLKQAHEVLRMIQEGKPKDARKKLDDLQRKTDELIEKRKIRGAATSRVRQAVTEFSNAVRGG